MNNEICYLRHDVEERKSENFRLQQQQELSHQINSETALRQSEEKFRLAFQTSPDSINFNRLSDGIYIDINEGFTDGNDWMCPDCYNKYIIPRLSKP